MLPAASAINRASRTRRTEENESRADRDVGHYFIIVRRWCRWRRVEERPPRRRRTREALPTGGATSATARGVHVGGAKAAAIAVAPRGRGDVFDHLYGLCGFVLSTPGAPYELVSPAQMENFLHGTLQPLGCKQTHPRLRHAYRTLAFSVFFVLLAC